MDEVVIETFLDDDDQIICLYTVKIDDEFVCAAEQVNGDDIPQRCAASEEPETHDERPIGQYILGAQKNGDDKQSDADARKIQ